MHSTRFYVSAIYLQIGLMCQDLQEYLFQNNKEKVQSEEKSSDFLFLILNIVDISYDDGAHDGLVEKEDDDFGLDWTKILAGIKLPES